MEEVITQFFVELSKYGLPGIVIGVCVFFIYRMQTIYQQERAEWRQTIEKQHEDLLEVTKDTHTILTEIKGLIQFKK